MSTTPPSVCFRPPPPLEGDKENYDQLEVMIRGEPYMAGDPYLERVRHAYATRVFDAAAIRDSANRMAAYHEMIHFTAGPKAKVHIAPGFVFEYGFNISLGNDMYLGPNCGFYDVCQIKVGDRTMFGPDCKLFTPTHPLSPEARDGINGPEWGKPITIGKDCWFGGSVIVCPGVTIGDGCTIGAGSVVTKHIPDRSVAVGNPAKVVKRIKADGTTENV